MLTTWTRHPSTAPRALLYGAGPVTARRPPGGLLTRSELKHTLAVFWILLEVVSHAVTIRIQKRTGQGLEGSQAQEVLSPGAGRGRLGVLRAPSPWLAMAVSVPSTSD